MYWTALEQVGWCHRTHTFVARASVWQDIEDGPDVLVADLAQEQKVWVHGRSVFDVYAIGDEYCSPVR